MLFKRSDPVVVPGQCSFCGKMQSEVEKLISGSRANICNECVIKCVAVLDRNGAEKLEAAVRRLTDDWKGLIRKELEWLKQLHAEGLIATAVYERRQAEILAGILPNQAPEPTSTAVTPPADAGDRASGTRGSS